MKSNFFAFSSLLIFISSLLMAFFLLYKGRKNKFAILWMQFCLITSIWGLGGYKFSTTQDYNQAFLWWQIAYICVILAPVFYIRFIFNFLHIKNKKHILFFIYILAGIFLIFNFFFKELFLGDLRFVFNQFYCIDWIKHKSIIWLIFYIGFYWILLGYAFLLLLKAYNSAVGLKRFQLKYFILGSIIGWLGPFGDYLPAFRIDIYPYSNFLSAIYPLIIAYAILKHRLMDIQVTITRVGIFSVLYILLLFIPFYIGYQTKSWVLSAIFAFIFASIGPSIFYRLQKKAVDLILSRQRRYQEALLKMAKDMVTVHELERLLRLIAVRVKREVRIRYDAVFFHDRRNKIYSLKYMCSYKLKKKLSLAFKEDEELIEYLKNKEPFLYEETEPKIREYLENALGTSYSLIVPSSIHDELVGFLILGEKLDKSHYSIDDINTFKTLSRQAALAIDYCLFLEEFKRTQEELLQAEKLASIGGMADGIAHQIKNRLNCFSLIAQEMMMSVEELRSKNPRVTEDKEIKEFLEHCVNANRLLLENVKRTNNIIRSMLDFAKIEDKDKQANYFFVREVINSCVELLCMKHAKEEFPLEVILVNSEIVWGIKTQLTEVIYNILDNAYEAIEQLYHVLPYEERKKHTPRIIFKLEEFPQYYLITVSDNGIGIKDEDKDKIFAPFFTTKSSYKKSGSGIGMYVVRRIIEENHKGRIWFESRYLKGTTFYIQLPKKGMEI